MVRKVLSGVLAAVAVLAAGCGDHARTDAAKSVQEFLTAAKAGDTAAFEAAIDREAVRTDLSRQLVALARAEGVEVEGGPSDFALDRMITPDAFRFAEADTGAAIAGTPSTAQIAALLKPIDKTHMCLKDLEREERCLLTFAKRKDGWRLVGMQATDLRILVRPQTEK